jgi:GT2 family glycosyltransferase
MRPDVSVIIVSYNVRDLLRSCIRSVLDQQIALEIIVVDNASADGTQEMIIAEFPQVVLLANQHNAGFSEANNQGMQLAKGRYIFLLNPDTIILEDAVEILLHRADSSPLGYLMAPQLLNKDRTLQVSCWKKPTPWAMIAESFFLHHVFPVSGYPVSKFSSEFKPGIMSGASLFFPSSWYKELGGLDPQLFWMEDADFCVRATKMNKQLLYLPSAKVMHFSGQSSASNLSGAISNQLLSKLKYYRKHQGELVMWLTSPFCLFHIVSRLSAFLVMALFSPRFAIKCRAYRYTFLKFYAFLFGGDKSVI